MPVPWTRLEAFITTEEAIPHQRAELFGNGSRVFDAEIGEATSGV
jgi:hypothetical protein